MPDIGGHWSTEFREFVRNCLKQSVRERYTINDALHSPFLVGMDLESQREACKQKWMQDVQRYNASKPQRLSCD